VTLAIAHRGEPVTHVENTLAAFGAAVAAGADMIELDCRCSSDGRVVVVHDRTLQRIWGLDRAVAATGWAEIAALSSDGEHVPLLSEVLDAVGVGVMVDVSSIEVMPATHAEVARAGGGALARCVFVGDTEALRWLRAEDPSVRIGLTWDRPELPPDELLAEIRPEWFNPDHRLATPAVIEAMHGRGLGVSTWTVDDEGEMSRLVDAGVEAVVTNRIAALVAVLGAQAAASGDGGREGEGGVGG